MVKTLKMESGDKLIFNMLGNFIIKDSATNGFINLESFMKFHRISQLYLELDKELRCKIYKIRIIKL